MAILADIFVSSPTDAPNYESLQSTGQLGRALEVVQFKGLTNLEFGILWAIIEGKEFDFGRHALDRWLRKAKRGFFDFPKRLYNFWPI